MALLALFALEGLAVVAYLAATHTAVTELRYLVYPFVWINVGLLAVWSSRPRDAPMRARLLGASIGIVYVVGVLAIPGNVGLGEGGAMAVRVSSAVPGWGPIVAVTGPVRLFLVPFEVIGYACLGYLVYANVIAASRRLLGGMLGFVTCVGCTVPIIAPLLGVLGGASGLASTAYAWSYDIGTVLFVLTAWLLVQGARAGR